MANVVIVAYKPKPGKEEALKKLMRVHMPVLKKEGLVTARPSIMMEAENGTIIEVFEWLSDEAIARAHTNPEVLKMWKQYFEVCDIIPLNTLEEAGSLFAGFKPFN